MDKQDRTTVPHDDAKDEASQKPRVSEKHTGAANGAVMGAVAVGPIGAPIGAAIGAVADALAPDPNEPASHTHDLDAPCYDGCPAWKSKK